MKSEMNDSIERIVTIVKSEDGLGLYDISNRFYDSDPSRWERNLIPRQACRSYCNKILNRLCRQHRIWSKNPDGKRRIYFYSDG